MFILTLTPFSLLSCLSVIRKIAWKIMTYPYLLSVWACVSVIRHKFVLVEEFLVQLDGKICFLVVQNTTFLL